MKYAFYVVVLANLILFLWEFQHGAFQPKPDYSVDPSDRQIWLLSEWVEHQAAEASRLAERPVDKSSEADASSSLQPQTPEVETASVVEQDVETQVLASEDTQDLVVAVAEQPEPAQTPAQDLEDEQVVGEVEEEALPTQDTTEQTSRQKEPLQVAEIDVCHEVGPFSDEKHMRDWIVKHGVEENAQPVEREVPGVSSYLVYYPAAETFIASERNVAMLQNKGIEDLWLINKGDMVGAISLGLFKEKTNADKLFERMMEKGLNVKMTERYKKEQVLYVRVKQAVPEAPSEQINITPCR